MSFSWVYYFFVALPETIASTLFAFTFLKQPIVWEKILKVGFIYGTTAFAIRFLPISFGVHSIILIVLFAILLSYFTKCKPTLTFIASLINVIVLGFGEIVIGSGLVNLLNISYDSVRTNEWLVVIFVIPQVIILVSLALIIQRYNLAKRKHVDEISQ